MRDNPFLALLLVFVPFSLVSVGGGASVIAGIQHQSVDVRHWIDAREFLDIFAVARAAPGPGSMLATLIGLKVAGFPGAVVATLAMFIPSSLLAFFVVRIWNRFRGTRLHSAFQEGLAPVGGGLLLAGALAVARLTDSGPLGWCVAAASAIILWLRPALHPAIVLILGACVFAAYGVVAG